MNLQRAVIGGTGQTETVVDEILLARLISCIHSPYLGKGDVALIHYHQILIDITMELLGTGSHEVEQAPRSLTMTAAVKVHRVVFNCGAVSDFAQHLQVILGALLKAMRLDIQTSG